MCNATTIFNLMTTAFARNGNYKVVEDMFERSVRFSPKEDHVWCQCALAMACEGRFLRSLLSCKKLPSRGATMPPPACWLPDSAMKNWTCCLREWSGQRRPRPGRRLYPRTCEGQVPPVPRYRPLLAVTWGGD
jgi:hypothetical protein